VHEESPETDETQATMVAMTEVDAASQAAGANLAGFDVQHRVTIVALGQALERWTEVFGDRQVASYPPESHDNPQHD
jgi:hypothetical protein